MRNFDEIKNELNEKSVLFFETSFADGKPVRRIKGIQKNAPENFLAQTREAKAAGFPNPDQGVRFDEKLLPMMIERGRIIIDDNVVIK